MAHGLQAALDQGVDVGGGGDVRAAALDLEPDGFAQRLRSHPKVFEEVICQAAPDKLRFQWLRRRSEADRRGEHGLTTKSSLRSPIMRSPF